MQLEDLSLAQILVVLVLLAFEQLELFNLLLLKIVYRPKLILRQDLLELDSNGCEAVDVCLQDAKHVQNIGLFDCSYPAFVQLVYMLIQCLSDQDKVALTAAD